MCRPPNEVQRVGIHHFQRTWSKSQELWHGITDFLQVCEVDQGSQRRGGLLHQGQPGFADDTERSFTADKQLWNIEHASRKAVRDPKQVVPATILAHGRLFLSDEIRVGLDQNQDIPQGRHHG